MLRLKGLNLPRRFSLLTSLSRQPPATGFKRLPLGLPRRFCALPLYTPDTEIKDMINSRPGGVLSRKDYKSISSVAKQFENTPENASEWKNIASKYAHSHPLIAEAFFGPFQKYGIHFDHFLGNAMLEAYALLGKPHKARRLWGYMHARHFAKGYSTAQMLKMYRDLGQIDEALDFLKAAPPQHRNIKTYGLVIHMLAKAGRQEDVFRLQENMRHEGVRIDSFIVNSLLHMYQKENNLVAGELLFQESMDSGLLDTVSYAVMSKLLLTNNKEEEAKTLGTLLHGEVALPYFIAQLQHAKSSGQALKIFADMKQRECEPNIYCYCMLLQKLAQDKRMILFQKWHNTFVSSELQPNTFLNNVLLLYFPFHQALDLFEKMLTSGAVDVVSFNTLMQRLYEIHRPQECESLFQQIPLNGLRPNDRSYGVLLKAMAMLGDLQRAKSYFEQMKEAKVRANSEILMAMVSVYEAQDNTIAVNRNQPRR